jgi:hypothetical protein
VYFFVYFCSWEGEGALQDSSGRMGAFLGRGRHPSRLKQEGGGRGVGGVRGEGGTKELDEVSNADDRT